MAENCFPSVEKETTALSAAFLQLNRANSAEACALKFVH